jgi:hypothetical protein
MCLVSVMVGWAEQAGPLSPASEANMETLSQRDKLAMERALEKFLEGSEPDDMEQALRAVCSVAFKMGFKAGLSEYAMDD